MTGGALDAVGHGELFALQRLQVVRTVGVQRDQQGVAPEGADLLHHRRDDGLRRRGSQRAVHKILLHIHNDQSFFHGVRPFFSRRRGRGFGTIIGEAAAAVKGRRAGKHPA